MPNSTSKCVGCFHEDGEPRDPWSPTGDAGDNDLYECDHCGDFLCKFHSTGGHDKDGVARPIECWECGCDVQIDDN